MDNIQNRLKQLRTYMGLTQRQISAELGVKPSYYSDLENGHRTITGKFIEKLKNKYSVSADWLYTGFGTLETLNSKQIKHPNSVPNNVPHSKVQQLNDIEKAFIWTDEQYENHKKNTDIRIKKMMESDGILELEFHKRLLTDIIQNHSKINALHSDLNDLRIFKYIIENLNYYYFNNVDLQLNSVSKFLKNGKFNYEDYKAAYLAELGKLEQIQPALHKISAAIKQFYKDIEAFDTENIVKGYFGEDIAKKSTK